MGKKLTVLEKTTNALNKLAIEREQIKSQRAALRRDIKTASNMELLEKAFRAAGSKESKLYKVKLQKLSKTPVMGLYNYGDLHFRGEKDVPALRKFFKTLRQDILIHKKEHVVLFSGGDDLEGAHRESTLLSIDKMPTGQAIIYQKILLEEITELAKTVKKLDINFLTSSNHTEWRIQGGAGEFPEDDALRLVAEYMKLGLKDVKNTTFNAKPWFPSIKIGKGNIAFAHGNTAIHKNLYKFKALVPDATIILRDHTHHSELIQEPMFDNLVGPSAKLHIEPYEVGGGWAQMTKDGVPFRVGQFIEFTLNDAGRVGELRVISV